MLRFVKLLMLLFLISLVGCSSKPKLAPLLTIPQQPGDKVSLIEVEAKFENRNELEENIVQLVSHQIKSNSSIVINVPLGLFEDRSEINTEDQDFKTKDFFNVAEQQIEKELMRNGFRVLSRSKFEAKLRSLRDESDCDISRWQCLQTKVTPDVAAIINNLKTQLDSGEITAAKFAEEVQLFREKFQSTSFGRSRNENEKELTDISEVIRAAESGDVQADYVLQINLFETELRDTVTTDLRYIPEVRGFLRQHKGIINEFEKGPNILRCNVVGSKLNAKLIHVKTGEITWIGEHQLDEFSSGVQQVSIELGSKKFVSNYNEVRNFVRNENTDYARAQRYGREIEIPKFRYSEALVQPTITAGRCEKEWDISPSMKTDLARQVAKELIGTIRVGR